MSSAQDSTTIRYSYNIQYYGEMPVDRDIGSGEYILRIVNPLPEDFTILQNFPNPFNPLTTLRYSLPENSFVNITIYDLLGRHVKTLINQTQEAGHKSVIWNATNDDDKSVSAGIYFYQIRAGEFVQTKKMVLLK